MRVNMTSSSPSLPLCCSFVPSRSQVSSLAHFPHHPQHTHPGAHRGPLAPSCRKETGWSLCPFSPPTTPSLCRSGASFCGKSHRPQASTCARPLPSRSLPPHLRLRQLQPLRSCVPLCPPLLALQLTLGGVPDAVVL